MPTGRSTAPNAPNCFKASKHYDALQKSRQTVVKLQKFTRFHKFHKFHKIHKAYKVYKLYKIDKLREIACPT